MAIFFLSNQASYGALESKHSILTFQNITRMVYLGSQGSSSKIKNIEKMHIYRLNQLSILPLPIHALLSLRPCPFGHFRPIPFICGMMSHTLLDLVALLSMRPNGEPINTLLCKKNIKNLIHPPLLSILRKFLVTNPSFQTTNRLMDWLQMRSIWTSELVPYLPSIL